MRMSSSLVLRSGIVAGALLLAACQQPTYYRPVSFGLEPIEAAWSAGFAGKVGYVELHGLPQTASASDLMADMSSPATAAPAAGFTTDPEKAADPRYRIVLAFGTAAGVDGNAACAIATDSTVAFAPTETGEVQAALCSGSERVSEIRIAAHESMTLGDGNRDTDRAILRQVVRHLYRPTTESDSDGSCSVSSFSC
jgi:hypothetical protein